MKRGLPIILSTKTASWISWASHFDFIIQLSIFMEENYIIIEGRHIFNKTIYATQFKSYCQLSVYITPSSFVLYYGIDLYLILKKGS